MSLIMQHLKARNDLYCAEEGLQQRMFRAVMEGIPDLTRSDPGHMITTAPTLDHSRFFGYASEVLSICPVEHKGQFSDLLRLSLRIPKAQVPYISVALQGFLEDMKSFDVDLANEIFDSILTDLSKPEILLLLASGAKSESLRSGKIKERLVSTDYVDALKAHVDTHRPKLLSTVPSATAMAIYRRQGWSGALEKAGSKARDKVFSEDLGL